MKCGIPKVRTVLGLPKLQQSKIIPIYDFTKQKKKKKNGLNPEVSDEEIL
jgi:hypothetical protein